MKNKKWYLLIAILLIGTLLFPITFAEGEERFSVAAGGSSLKEAIAKNPDVNYFELKSGSYGIDVVDDVTRGNDTIVIDRDITICGASGVTPIMKHLFEFKAKENGEAPTVTLCNYATETSNRNYEQTLLKATGKVNLTLENVKYFFVYRGTDARIGVLDVEKEASGSEITINNSYFSSSYDGIYLNEASNVKLNINKTELSGLYALQLVKGTGNVVNVTNNSKLDGRTTYQRHDESISIIEQNNLEINITDSIITGQNPPDGQDPGDKLEYLISFDTLDGVATGNPSNNVKIKILGKSQIIDNNSRDGSAVFNFGKSNTPTNSNVITIGKDVTFTYKGGELPFAKKYNTNNDYAVIGIKDKDGNTIIKAYDKNKVIPSSDIPDYQNYTDNDRKYVYQNSLIYTDAENENQPFTNEANNITRNMDISPLYYKELNIGITSTSGVKQIYHTLEHDTFKTFKEKVSDAASVLDALQKVSNKEFVKFVDTNEDSEEGSKEVNENYVFLYDTDIIPVYNVKVTIEDDGKDSKVFTLKENQTLNDLKGDDKTYLESLENDKYFSRLVNKLGNTFDKDTRITENITLTVKRNNKITVNNQEYYLEKGLKLSQNEEIKSTLQALQTAEGKTFKEYSIDTSKYTNLDDLLEVTPNKDIEIKANYTVKVTIKDGDTVKKEVTIDEGQKLGNDVLEELKEDPYFSRLVKEDGSDFDTESTFNKNTTLKIKKNIKITIKKDENNQTDYYLEEGLALEKSTEITEALEALKTVQGKHFKDFYNETEKAHIIDYTYKPDTDIVIIAHYQYKVTIVGEAEFYVVENSSLDETTDTAAKAEIEEITQSPDFMKFVDENGEEVKTSDKITRDITLTVVRSVHVTINNKSYPIEKGKKFSEVPEIMAALKELEVPGLHLKEYLNKTENKTILKEDIGNTATNVSIEIIAIYNVIVTLDDELVTPNKTIIIDKDQTLEQAFGEEKTYLDALLSNPYFSRFVDEEGNTFTTNTSVPHDITLKVMRNNKVTIDGKDYYLEKGLKLSDKEEIANALEALKNVQGKHFKEYYVEEEVITKDYKPTEDIVIGAHYNVVVTIDGEEFTINEGESLKDIKGTDLERLNKLKNGKYFASYLKDGQEFADSTAISEDTTLTIKRNVKVVVNDTEYYVLKDSILSSNTELNNALEELAKGTNKQFKAYYDVTNERVIDIQSKADKDMEIVAQFTVNVVIDGETFTIDEGKSIKDIEGTDLERLNTLKNGKYFSRYLKDNETFKEDTKITENTTLTIKRNVKVIIEAQDYYIEDGLKLKDNADVVKALDAAKNLTTKQFMEFYDVDTQEKIEEPLELDAKEDLKIKARYKIDVKINGKDYMLEENSTLESLPLDAKEELQKMREISNKQFVKFVDKNGNEVDFEKALTENLEIIPIYNVKVTIDDEEFIIPEGTSLKDIEGSDLERLNTLKNGKYFSRYLKDNETFKEDTKIMENTTLTIKRNVKVVIDKEYYLEKGNKLSSDKNIVEAIEGLKKVTNKQFKEYVKDDKVLENPLELVANDDMVITANYEIEVIIDDKKYTLQEGQSLNDLEKEVLDKLKEIMKKDTFAKFVNSKNEEILLDTKLMENTTITAKYNVLVKIGDDKFIVTEGMTLNDLSKEDKLRLEELKNNHAENLKFKGYKNVKTGEEFTDKTPITSDIELELVFEEIKEEEPTPEVKPDDKPTTDETDKPTDKPTTGEENKPDTNKPTTGDTNKPDTNKPSNPSNDVPKTFDNIITYIVLGITSLIALIGGVFFIRRKSLNK